MAAHGRPHRVVNPIQAADVVYVAVGNDYRAYPRQAKPVVVVEDGVGPLSPVVASVDQHHLIIWVADEVVVRSSGMGHGTVVYVHVVNVRGDLHCRLALLGKF